MKEEEEVSCLDELSDGSLDCGQEEGDESSTSVQRRRTISQKRESLCTYLLSVTILDNSCITQTVPCIYSVSFH